MVGGGPAGSSLAIRLARVGIPVRILDARAFPRSKPCGDCVSPGAVPLLREVGVLDRLTGRGVRLHGWWIRSPGGVWFGGRFGGPVGPAVPRATLDATLVDAARAAGAVLEEGIRVYALLRRRGRVVGVRARDPTGASVERRARWVVGADGLRSVVARRIGEVARGRRRRLALVARVEAGAGRPGAEEEVAGTRFGRMLVSAGGCLGLAPIGAGRWNLSLVVPAAAASGISGDPTGFFRRRATASGVDARLLDPLENVDELEVTGPFEMTPERRSAPGVLLVGDAAGYLDPFTGQGIYRALATARLAAGSLLPLLTAGTPPRRPDGARTGGDAPTGGERPRPGRWPESRAGTWPGTWPESPDERAARLRYERGLDRLLGPSRRTQRALDAVVSRPRIMDGAARLLRARPGLASLLVRIAGDLEPPGSLLHPARLARAAAGPRPSVPTPDPPHAGSHRAHA